MSRSSKTSQWTHKVVKTQRGMDGKWFRYPAAATFASEPQAHDYAKQFAAEQKGVPGTRILVVARKGGAVTGYDVE